MTRTLRGRGFTTATRRYHGLAEPAVPCSSADPELVDEHLPGIR